MFPEHTAYLPPSYVLHSHLQLMTDGCTCEGHLCPWAGGTNHCSAMRNVEAWGCGNLFEKCLHTFVVSLLEDRWTQLKWVEGEPENIWPRLLLTPLFLPHTRSRAHTHILHSQPMSPITHFDKGSRYIMNHIYDPTYTHHALSLPPPVIHIPSLTHTHTHTGRHTHKILWWMAEALSERCLWLIAIDRCWSCL